MDTKSKLPLGTLIECDEFSSISVSDDMLLVFDTDLPGYIDVNDVLRLEGRGSNDWAIITGSGFHYDYGIRRDWNGCITTYMFLDPDSWDDWDWDFCWEWWENESYDEYDDYRRINNPDRNPRERRRYCGRRK